MASLDGNDLGKVQSEGQTKSSEMFNMPIPTTDSDEAIILDLFGISKNISLAGILTGSEAELNTFIVAMETIKSGTQTGVTFISSLSTYANKTVYIQDFSWIYISGSPRKISYTLELIEGASS